MEVRPRFRPDLEPFVHDEGDGEPVVVLKDPISDRFFRLSPHEHLFLRAFDGSRTIPEGRAMLASKGHFVSEDEAKVVLGRADQMGLLLGTGSQRATLLDERRRRVDAARAKGRLSQFFFAFIPVCNPDRFLGATLPLFRLLVNRYTAWLTCVAAPFALYLIAAGWPRIQRETAHLFSAQGVVALAATTVCVKLLHELCHGWVAKGFGLRVPRMGIALLLWVPYLYCDTTEAWQLGSRRQRIWVSAAGIVSEVVMAIVAVFVWYFSRDGVLNAAAFHVMAVSLLSTFLLNANPLMKRDGYYVLSDLLRAPNLAAKSFAHLKFLFLNGVLGVRGVDSPAESPLDALTYTVYSVLAFAYKLLIYSGIVSAVYFKFDKALGALLALIALVMFVLAPCAGGLVYVMTHAREIRPRPGGVAVFGLALAALAFGVFRPLASSSVYPCWVAAARTQALAVPLQAAIGEVKVQRGSHVKAGALLFDLRTDELALMLRKKELDRDAHALQHEQLLVDKEEHARADVRAVEVARLEDEVAHLRDKLKEAQAGVRAPFDAVVTRIDARVQPGYRPGEGAVVGEVESDGGHEVHALVPDRDRHLVRVGLSVRVWLASGAVVPGTITEIRSYNEKDLHDSAFVAAAGGELATEARDGTDRDRPLEPQYRCTVRVEASGERSGTTGRMAVPRAPRSLFQATVDQLFHTFNRETLI